MKKNNKKKELKLLTKTNKQKANVKWVLTVIILAFTISVVFSLVSDITLSKTSLFVSILILLLFIIVGILFDIIGVSVTSSDEAPFHSMASRKIKGSKTAIYLIKNASKVSSICCDVIGDICGIISGAAGVSIVSYLINITHISPIVISLIVTGIVASLTIGGKALSKSFAINNSNLILNRFAKVLSFFKKEK